jgi:hypothetical protein
MLPADGVGVVTFTGAERDFVSCIFSSRIDACCLSKDRESNAPRPRGDCGKWFTLAAIGSGGGGTQRAISAPWHCPEAEKPSASQSGSVDDAAVDAERGTTD